MIEEVNQWSFELHKRLFVFTEKTLGMRDFFRNIETREVLSFSTDAAMKWTRDWM